MAESAAHYHDMLREQGYINLEFPISGADIDPLFSQFREFIDIAYDKNGEETEFVKALHYEVPERPKDGSYHFVHRRPGLVNPYEPDRAPGTDSKDLAHIGPRSKRIAEERLGSRMPKVMRDFLTSCVELHEATKSTVRPVYRALNVEDIMLAKNPEDDIHMVRVLRYLGTTASHKADIHFDRSVATFAAWESSPGLVGVPGDNATGHPMSRETVKETIAKAQQAPIEHVSGEGKFFLGAGYNRLSLITHQANGYLPLLAHGVINDNPGEERDAVVVFMNPALGTVPYYKVPLPHETGLKDLLTFLGEPASDS